MSMSVVRALIFSSKQQAEAFECYPGIVAHKKRYRLLVTHFSGLPDGDVFKFGIYAVSYPDSKTGKGWGEPVYAEKPHTQAQWSTVEEMRAFFEKYDINFDECWEPVEDDQEER